MAMSFASKYGFKGSLSFMCGIFVGFFMIIALCCATSVGLYRLIPSIKPAMTGIGALYILWLAWKTLKSKPPGQEAAAGRNNFLAGILLQFVNPKVILYGLTIVSTFIIPYDDSPIALLLFAVFLALIGFISTCCWAVFGAVFQKFLAKHEKPINVVLSLMLIYCAVSLFK